MWELATYGSNSFIMAREVTLSDTLGRDMKYAKPVERMRNSFCLVLFYSAFSIIDYMKSKDRMINELNRM
jgi:hypothetical protein